MVYDGGIADLPEVIEVPTLPGIAGTASPKLFSWEPLTVSDPLELEDEVIVELVELEAQARSTEVLRLITC